MIVRTCIGLWLGLLSIMLGLIACNTGGTDLAPLPTPKPTTVYGVPDLNGREVSIAVENAYLPFNYVLRETNEAAGWDYDLWQELCRRLNCTPVFVPQVWDGLIDGVRDGRFDTGEGGLVITEERKEFLAYSDAYIMLQQRLLVRSDDVRFDNYKDFATDETTRLAALPGTTDFRSSVQLVGEERVVAADVFTGSVRALLDGEVDGVFVGEVAGQGFYSYGAKEGEAKLIGPPFRTLQFGLIFPLESDLVEPVNKALDTMRADGTLEKLTIKFFSPAFTITYDHIGAGAYGE
ncbi:MAG: amino acid ABC transporter substrate-binding protein [Anaerolineae bacterium]|nr:amino acid ABC transporter substrate-binding protein [Anaerolineae bacterium]